MVKALSSSFQPKLARGAADDSGVAAIEFAMLAPMFIAMMLVITFVGVLFMAKAQLDYTTQKVARLVMTGQVTSQSQLQTAICNLTGALLSCNSIMANLTAYTGNQLDSINTSTATLTYDQSGAVSNTWNAQFGAAGSIMVLQLMYQYPTIVGPMFDFATQSNGTFLMISNAVFVNE